jgi:transcriptional regulator with XRE-family HTH domain
MKDRATMSETIRHLRKAIGWTQQELAVRAGLSVRGYAGYECGERHPEPRAQIALAAIAMDHGCLDHADQMLQQFIGSLRLTKLASHQRRAVLQRLMELCESDRP